MRILGIDTSGKVAAAALYDSVLSCVLAQQVLYTKRTHSQVIMPLVERILSDTGMTWQDIDGIAVANGPGSYTGLRIGVAAVKAMTFALDIPCIGISTLEGLAWQSLTWQGYLCPVMAARQTLLYTGLYKSDGKTITCIWDDQICEISALLERLATLDQPVVLTGDAAGLVESDAFCTASPAVRLQNGIGLCLAAASRECWSRPESLMPEYLQLVKAEKDLRDRKKA